MQATACIHMISRLIGEGVIADYGPIKHQRQADFSRH